MPTEGTTPNDQDVQAVEQRLASLYTDLPPAQQTILETILAAGLGSLATAEEDTAGHGYDLDTHFEAQKLELQRVWRRADQLGPLGDPPATDRGSRGSLFQPVIEFFRRVGATPAQAPRAGGTPA